MISRGEVAGLVAAAVGHGALFALLALGFLEGSDKAPSRQTSMEVSLVDKVGLEMAAPVISSEEQAAKRSELEAEEEEEPAPAEPEPEPVKKPDPKPAAKPDPAAAPSKDRSGATASGSGDGRRGGGRPGLKLDLGVKDGEGESPNPPAKMTGEAMADIGSAIVRQTKPCADRQAFPGPGAERIRAVVRLRLNRDGTLTSAPEIIDHTGVDDTNQLYVRRVDDAVKAIFAGCTPLRGLPDELYDVTNGWKVFTLRYRLTG